MVADKWWNGVTDLAILVGEGSGDKYVVSWKSIKKTDFSHRTLSVLFRV